MKYVYTKHQTPRGAMADAEVDNKMYLIKRVSQLRLTYQIRMLTYIAKEQNKKLIIQLPETTKIHGSLRGFIRDASGLIKVERVK